MIRKVSVNADAYTIDRLLINHPEIERVSDMCVSQVPNVPISDADVHKYAVEQHDLKLKNIPDGRYINSQHARVKDINAKWPDNALPVELFGPEMYYGPACELRPGVKVQRYNLLPETNRAKLADALTIEHARFPDRDLFLDGVVVPELVDSHVPWRFTHVCDLLAKVRQRLDSEDQLGINLAGALADLKMSQMNLLIDSGVKLITFEQGGASKNIWRCSQNAGYLLLKGVTPVLLETDDDSRRVCEVVGAALGV